MKHFCSITSGLLVLLLALSLISCGKDGGSADGTAASDVQTESAASEGASAGTDETASEAAGEGTAEAAVPEGEFSLKDESGKSIDPADSVYTVTAGGEYTLSGVLSDGQVVVDAGEDDEVVLILSSASLSSSSGAPILGLSADKLTVRSEKGTYNLVTDLRAGGGSSDKKDESDRLNDDAAIYAKCDLKITGKGALTVSSVYENGIKSTKDLSVKNVTLKVNSPGIALKGNDSITIKSGSVTAVSSGSAALKTRDSNISKKGNQRGNVLIEDGQLEIFAEGDGIHAAYDIIVNGGDLLITSGDDAMHAEREITVNGGTVRIEDAHEGIEANVITVNGGSVSVSAEDDGLNACGGDEDTLIRITGGYLEVTTPSGDTDGIDSNGDIEITGGTVLVRGGAAMGGMAGSIDLDGTITMTGGTVVAFGGICETPSGDAVNVYLAGGTEFSAGTYSLEDESGEAILEFTLDGRYSSCWMASDAFETGKSYTLNADGSSVLSWTQSSSVEGTAGNAFGPGGSRQGGGPGGRR